MTIKQQLFNKCQEHVENRIKTVQDTIESIQKALLSETKSSAGDKHETGRAMLQLEREKAGQQLAEALKEREILKKVNIKRISSLASLGSLVYTSQANYFIAISIGEIQLSNTIFFAISPKTPIGKLLFSKTVGDTVIFNNNDIEIIKIV